jgi:hypothetical protein
VNILWFSFSLITAEPWHRSLPGTRVVYYYDKITRPPGLLSVPPDREMLDIARGACPDIVLFCGIADRSRMPSPETFNALRKLCPVVMLSGDLSDPPWWPYLEIYKDCFDLIVNFDGNDNWPKRHGDFTALTPIATEFYPVASKQLNDRLIPFGFCGGCASPSRWEIIGWLVDNAGLQIKPREETYGTYARYARFMQECSITISVPFSGSDNSRQVKGRVLESGLARTVLLDHVSSAAKNYFTPGIDYVEYETREHAAELVRELMNDWPRAQRIADSLHDRVKAEHSPAIFWDKVFKAAGVK